MGPISMVGAGACGSPGYPPPAVTASGGAAVGGSAYSRIAVASSSVVSTSMMVTNVQSAVGDLLQGIDGELANNKMLRMLIALLILSALLQNSQSASDSADRALNDLGGGSKGTSWVGASSSSTAIHSEQSSSTWIAVEAFSAAGSADGGQQPAGGQIDVSV